MEIIATAGQRMQDNGLGGGQRLSTLSGEAINDEGDYHVHDSDHFGTTPPFRAFFKVMDGSALAPDVLKQTVPGVRVKLVNSAKFASHWLCLYVSLTQGQGPAVTASNRIFTIKRGLYSLFCSHLSGTHPTQP